MRFVYNDASSRKTAAVVQLQPVRIETVRHEGTVKAQLVGKLGPQGFSRLLAEMKEIK